MKKKKLLLRVIFITITKVKSMSQQTHIRQ